MTNVLPHDPYMDLVHATFSDLGMVPTALRTDDPEHVVRRGGQAVGQQRGESALGGLSCLGLRLEPRRHLLGGEALP